MQRPPALALIVLAALAGSVSAQTVDFTKIVDEDTRYRGWGNRPALDGGHVAFLGTDTLTDVDGIYLAPADGQGPVVPVVESTTPVPNAPGANFVYLDNPEVHEGVVAFTGGHLLPTISDGIYLGSGGSLTVHHDHFTDLVGTPGPFDVVLGPEGLAFRSTQPDPSNFLFGSRPYFSPAPADVQGMLPATLPGGGTPIQLVMTGENPAMEGGVMAFTLDVNHAGGVDRGVYTRDLATGTVSLVANWETDIPGGSGTFEDVFDVDTDGVRVVFQGGRGNPGFGGETGVYTAPVGGGPLVRIAAMGDAAPGSDEAFASFSSVAVEGDLVVFEAALGSVFVPTGGGIYGWRAGELFRIVDHTSILDGQPMSGFDMNHRGLDDGRLVFRASYAGSSNTKFAVYVAALGETGVWTDLGGGTPGLAGTPALTGAGPLLGGSTATLDLTNAPPGAPLLAWLSFSSTPFAALGGTVHATPFAQQFLFGAQPDGSFGAATTWPAGIAPGTSVWFQFIVEDATSQHGLTLSNGLQATTP